MKNLIHHQLEKSRSGLTNHAICFRATKPKDVKPNIPTQTFLKFTEAIHFISAFAVIFTALMLYSNWSAYTLIAQDWIDTAFASEQTTSTSPPLAKTAVTQPSEAPKSSSAKTSLLTSVAVFPPGKWLEVPKIKDGLIPIQMAQNIDFDYASAYNQAESEFQKALQKGVLHYPFTADPGKYGNVFITGHSSYYPWAPGEFKEIFALLYKLQPGDTFSIYSNLKKYTYEVYATFEVAPNDVSVLDQPTNVRMATLMTCTPTGTTLRRLIIQAKQISEEG